MNVIFKKKNKSRYLVVFFFSSRRRHTRWPRDWSSDVCSSDLAVGSAEAPPRNDRQHDEQDEKREGLQIDRGDAHRVGVGDGHVRPVGVCMRAGRELLNTRPDRPQAVPEPSEGPGIREAPVPEAL